MWVPTVLRLTWGGRVVPPVAKGMQIAPTRQHPSCQAPRLTCHGPGGSWSIGLRGTWLSIPEQIRPRARAAVLERVGRKTRGDGRLMERFAVEYVTAKR